MSRDPRVVALRGCQTRVVRSRTSYNNHNTMTSKGWVSRKREQFESFAKSVDDQNNVLMTVAKPQPNLQNVGYKPPQEDVKIKASEVKLMFKYFKQSGSQYFTE